MPTNKITYLVDGSNLYHSVRKAGKQLQASTKWLDLKSLCISMLHNFRPTADKLELENIYYFSAYAYHLNDPNIVQRHKSLVACLEDTGVKVEINRFKYKGIDCPFCKKTIPKYEEKETDVSIALKLQEIFIKNECDVAVLVSGDTDLAPAVRLALKLFPEKHTFFAFPAFRKNNELAKLCPGSITINPKQYSKHQLPNPYILQNSSEIFKPASW